VRRFTEEYATRRLEGLFAALWSGGELDPLAREWLTCGILGALREGASLDKALGLSASGVRSTRARLLASLRDHHLSRAIDAMDLDGSVGPWERCKRLAPLVREFEARTWPAYRYLERPPADWPRWKRALFAARQTGLELPGSTKQLHRVWQAGTQARGFSCPGDADTVHLARFI
jgi:hypothetical protein